MPWQTRQRVWSNPKDPVVFYSKFHVDSKEKWFIFFKSRLASPASWMCELFAKEKVRAALCWNISYFYRSASKPKMVTDYTTKKWSTPMPMIPGASSTVLTIVIIVIYLINIALSSLKIFLYVVSHDSSHLRMDAMGVRGK